MHGQPATDLLPLNAYILRFMTQTGEGGGRRTSSGIFWRVDMGRKPQVRTPFSTDLVESEQSCSQNPIYSCQARIMKNASESVPYLVT